MSKAMLEILSNEILLDIFEYLNLSDLFHAFHHLNIRFERLLYGHLRCHSVDFRSMSKDNFDLICQQYLPLLTDRIFSLCLSDDDKSPNQPQIFFSSYFTIDKLKYLKSLSLYSIYSWNFLNDIIYQCRSLFYLTHINIINNLRFIDCQWSNQQKDNTNSLVDNIWSLPKLTHCCITNIFFDKFLPETISVVSSSLNYLVIDESFHLMHSYYNLFEHTPHLQLLTITSSVNSSDNSFLQVVFPSLTTLKYSFSPNGQSLNGLWQNLPNLTHLTFNVCHNCLDKHWNGYIFEDLLNRYVPHLIIFRFRMSFGIRSQTNSEYHVNQLLDSFRTSFWLDKHRIYVRCHYYPSSGSLANELNIIYSLPYAFETFHYSGRHLIKSTCPNENDYYQYNHVRTVYHDYLTMDSNQNLPIIEFPFLQNYTLHVDYISCLKCSRFDRLICLCIRMPLAQTTYQQLLVFIKCARHLFSITLEDSRCLPIEILQQINPSIRSLNFIKTGNLNFGYLNHTDCIKLVNSSLGQQCEYLTLYLHDHNDILYLVQHMRKLRSLIALFIRPMTIKRREKTDKIFDESYCQWLRERLPYTCICCRHRYWFYQIRIWMSQKSQQYYSRQRFFRVWSFLRQCIPR